MGKLARGALKAIGTGVASWAGWEVGESFFN